MAITFEKTPIKWEEAGSTPSEELQTSGFQAGMKPAAQTFNALFNNTSECLTELQTQVSEVDDKVIQTQSDLETLDGEVVKGINASGKTIPKSSAGIVNLTPSNLGVAPSTHYHNASNINAGTLPIERGGTGGATEAAARENLNVYQMVVLYSNGTGTAGTVTLHDSVHNYQYIEIFYRSGNYYYDSVRIAFGSETKYSNLSVVNPSNGNVYIDTRTICISGTSITNSNTGQCGIENGSSYSNKENHIAINRVMGYKF